MNWARSLLASPGVRRIGRVVPRPLRRIVAALLARLDEPRAVRLRQLSADVESRLLKACAAETHAWRQIRSRAQWKAFLEPRLVSLRRSLGTILYFVHGSNKCLGVELCQLLHGFA